MASSAHSPKLLLLQFRQSNDIALQEINSFIQYTQIKNHQLDSLNTLKAPEFEPSIVENYDAILIGGASGISVTTKPHPKFILQSLELIRHCININKPVFASCYGFQLALIALEGCISRDEINFEKGTPNIYLSEIAKQDPLFNNTPSPFRAVSVHQDKASSLPKNCELLAFNDDCIHAFRIKNKPFWAVQFHPETDIESLTERLNYYKTLYTNSQQEYEDLLNSCVATPHSHALLPRFIAFLQAQLSQQQKHYARS